MTEFAPLARENVLGADWFPDKSPLIDSSHNIWPCAVDKTTADANRMQRLGEPKDSAFNIIVRCSSFKLCAIRSHPSRNLNTPKMRKLQSCSPQSETFLMAPVPIFGSLGKGTEFRNFAPQRAPFLRICFGFPTQLQAGSRGGVIYWTLRESLLSHGLPLLASNKSPASGNRSAMISRSIS